MNLILLLFLFVLIHRAFLPYCVIFRFRLIFLGNLSKGKLFEDLLKLHFFGENLKLTVVTSGPQQTGIYVKLFLQCFILKQVA